MKLDQFRFPLEGNVQNLAHFYDMRENYAFTFGSPFCYTEPAELREKKAFLLAEFPHMKKKVLSADSIHAYYINEEERKPYPDKKVKVSVRNTQIYRGDGTLLGTLGILLPKGMFRSYQGIHPNPIYDAAGKLTGFCIYNPAEKSKDVYTCAPDFSHLTEALPEEKLKALTAEGSIERVFSYDVVDSEGTDTKDRFLAIFSASKKSELSNNRLRHFGGEMDEDQQTLLFTSLFAFFWGTYIDLPLR